MGIETLLAHPERSAARRWPRRVTVRWWLALGMLVVLAVGAWATHAWTERRADIDRTVASTHATRVEVTRTAAVIEAATATLAGARASLETERTTLTEAERDRDAVAALLSAAQQHLTELQAQLTAAQADLAARSAQLDALNVCVLGVTEALNQAGASDRGGLARTLSRIEGTCARAGAAL
jgi:septal ring factor EnvC (AmiA/AmiB activator)